MTKTFFNTVNVKDSMAKTFFRTLNDKSCVSYDIISKLSNLGKYIQYEYEGNTYNVEIHINSISSRLLSFSNSYCDLTNKVFIIYHKIENDSTINPIFFNTYKVETVDTKQCLILKNLIDLCPKYDNYEIHSPLNLKNETGKIGEFFYKKGNNIFSINDRFYEIDYCEPYEYDGYDLNLQTRVKSIFLKNKISQENCSVLSFDSYGEQTGLTSNCSTNPKIAINDSLYAKQIVSEIEADKFYKANNIHIKIFTCFDKISTNLVINYLFYIWLIFLIALIVFIIIFYKRDTKSLLSKLLPNYKEKNETMQIEKTRSVEVPPKIKKKNDAPNALNIIKSKKSKMYSYVVAIIENEVIPEVDLNLNLENNPEEKKRKKRSLKNEIKRSIIEKERAIEENTDTCNDETKWTIEPEQEYFEYLIEKQPPPEKPKKYIQEKYYVTELIKFKELSPENQYQLPGIVNFLLTHVPITNIFVLSQNNTGSIRRFIFESHFLNAVFTIILFFTLGMFNTLFFNDNLFVINFDNKGLGAGKYFLYSIIGCLINIAFGFILMAFFYFCRRLSPGKLYKEEEFENGLKKSVGSHKCKIFLFILIGIIISLVCWYYLCIFGNIYPNSKKYLLIQIIISFIFENIFYFLIFAGIWAIIKYACKK